MTNSNALSELRLWSWWFAIGLLLTMLVVYLSLANIDLPQVPSGIGDKVNHMIAYGVLYGWFGQLFSNRPNRLIIAVSLVLLGLLMELMQGQTEHRFFDLKDAVANTLGVLLGWLAVNLGADKLLLRFENLFYNSAQ